MTQLFIHDGRLKVISARIIELKNLEIKKLKQIQDLEDTIDKITEGAYDYIAKKNTLSHRLSELNQIRNMMNFNKGLLTHDESHLLQLEN